MSGLAERVRHWRPRTPLLPPDLARLVKPDDDLFTSRYARWTRQNKRNRVGRYRFVLAAAWDTRTLADGRYVVEVIASDVSANTTLARFPIRIANRGARV